jgi:acyl carrier protein
VTREQVRSAVLDILHGIAPEADLAALDGAEPLREQLDLDSMDFLNFAIALHERLGVNVPEADYARVAALDGCVEYLTAALLASGA